MFKQAVNVNQKKGEYTKNFLSKLTLIRQKERHLVCELVLCFLEIQSWIWSNFSTKILSIIRYY